MAAGPGPRWFGYRSALPHWSVGFGARAVHAVVFTPGRTVAGEQGRPGSGNGYQGGHTWQTRTAADGCVRRVTGWFPVSVSELHQAYPDSRPVLVGRVLSRSMPDMRHQEIAPVTADPPDEPSASDADAASDRQVQRRPTARYPARPASPRMSASSRPGRTRRSGGPARRSAVRWARTRWSDRHRC